MFIALAILLLIVLLICYNAFEATERGEKVACSITISLLSALMVVAIFYDPYIGHNNANYYLNHQDEFVVDTISVNRVITELKVRRK